MKKQDLVIILNAFIPDDWEDAGEGTDSVYFVNEYFKTLEGRKFLVRSSIEVQKVEDTSFKGQKAF